MLELKPWELERLQPIEFILLVEGAIWRRERQEELLAYFTANIMSPHLKKPIQPKTLINLLRGNEKDNRKEEQKYFKEQFGLK